MPLRVPAHCGCWDTVGLRAGFDLPRSPHGKVCGGAGDDSGDDTGDAASDASSDASSEDLGEGAGDGTVNTLVGVGRRRRAPMAASMWGGGGVILPPFRKTMRTWQAGRQAGKQAS